MMRVKLLLDNLTDLLHGIKDKNLRWQTQNLEKNIQINHAKSLAKQQLAADISKYNQQLAHEISLLKTKQNNELNFLKTRYKADLVDYKEQLASLNQLKLALQASYPHLPETIIHTIYHHAKTLLNTMWDTTDMEDKLKCEAELVKFLTTVHEESHVSINNAQTGFMPQKTLNAINSNGDILPAMPLKKS